MPRFTVSVNDEQDAYLEEHADPPDRSKAAVVRELIDAARSGELLTEAHRNGDTAPVKIGELEELRERVAELEDVVAELRADRREEPVDAEREAGDDSAEAGDTTEGTPDPSMATARGSRPPSDTAPDRAGDVSIEELLAEYDQGRGRVEREERREVARVALEWLRDRDGRASGADFQAELLPEHGIDGQNETTWWRKTVRPAVQLAVEAGVVEYREGHHDYRWTGG